MYVLIKLIKPKTLPQKIESLALTCGGKKHHSTILWNYLGMATQQKEVIERKKIQTKKFKNSW